MNIFVEVLKKKLWVKSIFCNVTKAEDFLENRGHIFLDPEKNFQKRNFKQILFDSGQLEFLGIEGIDNIFRYHKNVSLFYRIFVSF